MSNNQQTVNLVEVFSAIQGEGLNVGTRQIFIRLAKCDLRCHFCDSSQTWEIPKTCKIEKTPGLRDFELYSNPIELPKLLNWIQRQNTPRLHDSISLTGGEPLLQSSFLQAFLPSVKELTHLPLYLETGGHRPQDLTKILPYLDMIGMDMKLPSVSGENRFVAHRDFLKRCDDSSVNTFVKLIISKTTNPAELKQVAELIASINAQIPVFLQPVTPLEQPLEVGEVFPPSPHQVLTWQSLMKEYLSQVRVIPQTHKMIHQL